MKIESFEDYKYLDEINYEEMIAGLNQLPSKQYFKDISILEEDRHGKIKFKKHSKKKSSIAVGDMVSNGELSGEVIDIDGDLVCVKSTTGAIEVWNSKDVIKIKN